VFTALAVSRWTEARTGWSIKRFVRTAHRYRTIEIQAGGRPIAAADPPPDDLRHALDRINEQQGAHQPGPSRVRISIRQPFHRVATVWLGQ
jgi:hypothetical protein